MNYEVNFCDPKTRIPKLEEQCKIWENCMRQDPYLVARRAVWTSETLGETVNAFCETLSWKAIALLLFIIWDRVLLQVGFVRAIFGVRDKTD